jgi:hypothetical protein
VLGHPFGTCQMALIGPSCTTSIMIGINVENDLRNIAPVGTICISGKHPDVGHGVLFVVDGQPRHVWSGVGAIRIEQPVLHRSVTISCATQLIVFGYCVNNVTTPMGMADDYCDDRRRPSWI